MQRAGRAASRLISSRPVDRLVGEVVGAVGDLLAGEGQQRRDEADADEHDEERGQPARQPEPLQAGRRPG